MSGTILIAATPLTPPQDGKCWAFHLVNAGPASVDSGVVEQVDYEWGDQSNVCTPALRFGAVPSGTALEIWRDDDAAAELRMSITFTVRVAGVDRKYGADFGMLYRQKTLTPIPLLSRDGILGSVNEVPAPEPRVRAWHSGTEFVVDRGRTGEGVVESLVRELPKDPWQELHDFARLDAQGTVVETYGVSTWCLDDELSVAAFAVIDNELRKRIVRTWYGSDTEREEKTILRGLREVSPWDRQTQDFLWSALQDERRRQQERRARHKKEGEERAASIPGPRRDAGLGEGYSRARNILRDRVKSYGDSLDVEFLTVLGRLGIFAESLPTPLPATLTAAAAALAAGGRRAAFDHSLDREKKALPTTPASGELLRLPAAAQSEVRSLIDDLAALHKNTLVASEIQSDADANANAREFDKAADLIAQAKRLLEGGLQAGPS